jgi:hypothetical protein
MPRYLALPDGSSITVPDTVSDESAFAARIADDGFGLYRLQHHV